VTVSSSTGRQIRRKRRARTYAEARVKLREMQEDMRAGIDPRRLTVSAQLDRWLARMKLSGMSRSTIENYRWAIDNYLRPALGGIILSKLTPDDIDKLLFTMADAGAAKNTMMRVRAVLSMAIDDAVARRLVSWNPVSATKTPAGPRRESRSFTAEEASTLLQQVMGDRLEALWLSCLLLGLRPGEVAGLVWSDIDLDAGVLAVRRARVHDPDGMRLGGTKTKRSVRTLEMPALLIEVLRRHRLRQLEERNLVGEAWQDYELVFTTTVGTPIDRWSLRRQFARMTETAGLGRWHPSELRHTTVSLLSDAGVSLEEIADIVGHSTTRMTGDTYRHPVRATAGGRGRQVMEELFGSK
jgi:integrase